MNGRGERIRTSDPLVPNQVLYQAEPLPDTKTRDWRRAEIIIAEPNDCAKNGCHVHPFLISFIPHLFRVS